MSEKDKKRNNEDEKTEEKKKKKHEDEKIKKQDDLGIEEEEDEDFEDLEDDFEEDEEEKKPEDIKRQNQNLWAIVVLLCGLFIASLFVEIAPIVTGKGLSVKKINEIEENGVFQSSKGKTWVLYEEPIVKTFVINDKDCEDCEAVEIIDALKKQVLPTAAIEEVDIDSAQGKELIEKYELIGVPSFIFGENVKETRFYKENGGNQILLEMNNMYRLDNSKAGIRFAKYIEVPEFNSDVAILGNESAEVPITIFGDFQCPYSKRFAASFSQVFDKHADNLKVTFKQLPLMSIHPQAYEAAHASLCANDQGRFWDMYNALYETQSEWGGQEAEEGAIRNVASTVGLDLGQYDQCMSQDIHRTEIESDLSLANDYLISGTPAAFIGDEYIGQAVNSQKIEEIILDVLNPSNEKGESDNDEEDESNNNEEDEEINKNK